MAVADHHAHSTPLNAWLTPLDSGNELAEGEEEAQPRPLSKFEIVISTYAPVLESLLLHCSTESILQLYHTSRFLQDFLGATPITWQYLSFRLPFPIGSPLPTAQTSPDDAASPVPRVSKSYALDQLLDSVVLPLSPCLRSLELDNTAVFGLSLTKLLTMRSETLQHLSVRGCKNVSLKYHIVPFLTMFALQYDRNIERRMGSSSRRGLALKSLYTYRCRHHRRRPYLSDSLRKKDSDSDPTHEVVELCHKLGIWTDTAWCTTPSKRCFRRLTYVSQRGALPMSEVYVVFDRLWRSRNWNGSTRGDRDGRLNQKDGRLWESEETAYQGEALGVSDGPNCGEGKTVPTHLRQSHRRFVEDVKCHQCGEDIPERCEQCSVLMHCVGCRKTLCHSCAFDRPYPRRKTDDRRNPQLWWAPNAPVSPNLVDLVDEHWTELHDRSSMAASLRFQWCCTQPFFSNGGGITIEGREDDRIRAVPLPRGEGWEDPIYTHGHLPPGYGEEACNEFPSHWQHSEWKFDDEMLGLPRGSSSRYFSFCPRNLCQDCYASPWWKVSCKKCLRPLCIDHDFQGLRLRICGMRDLVKESAFLAQRPLAMILRDDLPANMAQSNESARGRAFYEADTVPASPAVDNANRNTTFAPQQRSDSRHSSSSRSRGRRPYEQDEDRASLSVSESASRSSSPSSVEGSVRQQSPKWKGCHSFFCPQVRLAGDLRARCSEFELKECTTCEVLVCRRCYAQGPRCDCSYCIENYNCPNCFATKVQDGTCRRAAEEKARAEVNQHHANMRADAAGVEAMLINAMQSSRISRNASANRLQSFEDQLGSFLINPFMDSEDEGGQDVWDAYAAYANLDPEHMEEEGDEDPGIGPAPPVEHDDDDHINPEH